MELKIYKVPEDEKRAGMWTFAVDGNPSLLFATKEEAIKRRVANLIKGNPSKSILLSALDANASSMSDDDLKAEIERRVSESTLDGFMRRGKLALPED